MKISPLWSWLKVWLQKSEFCRKAICKLYLHVRVQQYLKVTVSGIFQCMGSGPLPCIHRGPLLGYRGAKDENLGAQKISTPNIDPFAEQRSERHFNIVLTCIPANKEEADA